MATHSYDRRFCLLLYRRCLVSIWCEQELFQGADSEAKELSRGHKSSASAFFQLLAPDLQTRVLISALAEVSERVTKLLRRRSSAARAEQVCQIDSSFSQCDPQLV